MWWLAGWLQAKAKNVAELGLSFLREYWPHIKRRFGDEEQPRDPADGAWDLHVNLPEAGASQVRQAASQEQAVPAGVCRDTKGGERMTAAGPAAAG